MSLPIGVFDSGVGGLTVMKAIAQALPCESILYFGDTARLPYGDKSPETIQKYTREGVRFLENFPVKMVVLACNTASAYAADLLHHTLQVPLIDVVGPSAQMACLQTRNKRIAVLGTHATIRSQCYPTAISGLLPQAHVQSIPCPLFVPLVEEGLIHHTATKLLVRDYLKEVIHNDCDTVILGCTHYPLLKDVIREELPPEIVLVDSALCCAEKVCEQLRETAVSGTAEYGFYVTDDSQRFQSIAARVLEGLSEVHKVELFAGL